MLQLMELFGYTGDDPGHWNFSPECVVTALQLLLSRTHPAPLPCLARNGRTLLP